DRAMRGEDANAPLWRRIVIRPASRDAFAGDAKRLIGACAKAFRAKAMPRDVLIYHDPAITNDSVFYLSPAAFALTSEIRDIASSIEFCDQPQDPASLRQIDL